jgi:hypothetical protein
MKRALALFGCVVSLSAQITTTVDEQAGIVVVRIRNTSSVNLSAFAVAINIVRNSEKVPFISYVDQVIETVAPVEPPSKLKSTIPPLLPDQEYTIIPSHMFAVNRKSVPQALDQPILTAGIFADGTTAGDPALLSRLILRRCNLLQAVETSLETLLEAGRRNVPREQMVSQFKKMADAIRRWYLPQEQQIGLRVYQPIIGKLTNLPQGEVGSPFPPNAFVEQETAMLNRQRVTLMASQPSLAAAAAIAR